MTRIMIFGTFDMIHEGHEDFFRQARALGQEPHLIVSVARDEAATRVKGKAPEHAEKKRLAALLKHPLVDKAVLGDKIGYIPHIQKCKPDIIALGYDQKGEYVDHLEEALSQAGLSTRIFRLKPHRPDEFKTTALKQKRSATLSK